MFDALIGNTDRHQDNWGVVWTWFSGEKPIPRLTPAFDNGTSMGHEILESNFFKFNNLSYLETYILRGKHHMKWHKDDSQRMRHLEMLLRLKKYYPSSRNHMVESLRRFKIEDIKIILRDMTSYDVSVPLSNNRAEFMLKLIGYRHELLLRTLEN